MPPQSGAADPTDETLRGARPESMAALLRVLAAEHGGARSSLVGHGVPDEAIDHLRTTLTEPGADQSDGATERQITRRITLPLLSPTLLFLTTLTILSATQLSSRRSRP
ncbi:hypothetical protein ACL02T_22390 [Pseudonocardia sp. RS010]|uniref:hypothetical protein n=1 Tax=Pseudonocardia sp. RS010 TaxID=3385979 RepID=UPI0039A06DE6